MYVCVMIIDVDMIISSFWLFSFFGMVDFRKGQNRDREIESRPRRGSYKIVDHDAKYVVLVRIRAM